MATRAHDANIDLGNGAKVINSQDPSAAQDLVTRQYMEDNVPLSTDVNDIVEISQASYDGLGGGRPASRLYLITS